MTRKAAERWRPAGERQPRRRSRLGRPLVTRAGVVKSPRLLHQAAVRLPGLGFWVTGHRAARPSAIAHSRSQRVCEQRATTVSALPAGLPSTPPAAVPQQAMTGKACLGIATTCLAGPDLATVQTFSETKHLQVNEGSKINNKLVEEHVLPMGRVGADVNGLMCRMAVHGDVSTAYGRRSDRRGAGAAATRSSSDSSLPSGASATPGAGLGASCSESPAASLGSAAEAAELGAAAPSVSSGSWASGRLVGPSASAASSAAAAGEGEPAAPAPFPWVK